MRDTQGLVGRAPGADPGVILTPWHPDSSWVEDELLRVTAMHGGMDAEYVYYNHIEVCLGFVYCNHTEVCLEFTTTWVCVS